MWEYEKKSWGFRKWAKIIIKKRKVIRRTHKVTLILAIKAKVRSRIN